MPSSEPLVAFLTDIYRNALTDIGLKYGIQEYNEARRMGRLATTDELFLIATDIDHIRGHNLIRHETFNYHYAGRSSERQIAAMQTMAEHRLKWS